MRTVITALVTVVVLVLATPASADPPPSVFKEQCVAAGGTALSSDYEGRSYHGCSGAVPPASRALCERAFGGVFTLSSNGYDCLLPPQGGERRAAA